MCFVNVVNVSTSLTHHHGRLRAPVECVRSRLSRIYTLFRRSCCKILTRPIFRKNTDFRTTPPFRLSRQRGVTFETTERSAILTLTQGGQPCLGCVPTVPRHEPTARSETAHFGTPPSSSIKRIPDPGRTRLQEDFAGRCPRGFPSAQLALRFSGFFRHMTDPELRFTDESCAPQSVCRPEMVIAEAAKLGNSDGR